jgi:palmitoyltransferase
MTGSSVHLAATNTTTIENLTRRTKVWTLAIHINRPRDAGLQREAEYARVFPTVTYPSRPTSTTVGDSSDQDSRPPEEGRIFAILQTQPGENPFDLGSPLKNLQQVMGYTLWDWLLPLKLSPCVNHSSSESAYAMGPVVERLKREAGLTTASAEDSNAAETSISDRRRSQHRRRRHHYRPRRRRSDYRSREPDATEPPEPDQSQSQPPPASISQEGNSNQ